MIAILKYNAGNSTSVENALNRLGYRAVITNDPDALTSADKVIIPGVGEASTAMQYLKEGGLDVLIKNLKKPVLGICLGQQLLCSSSEEGNTECLGIFKAKVKKFPSLNLVPQMGWNIISNLKTELFKEIRSTDDVYFVHSYYTEITDETIATCDYILPFSAAMNKANFYATQFHPEKSGDVGERILNNFLEL